MTFCDADTDRLLQPENMGLRIYAEVGKLMPGCAGDDYPIEALINEVRALPRDERDQLLTLVQTFDRIGAEIVIECGGSLPDSHATDENRVLRPAVSDNGFRTRDRIDLFSPAEKAIYEAMYAVERAGGSRALTDAITLLAKARERVADHMEGIE